MPDYLMHARGGSIESDCRLREVLYSGWILASLMTFAHFAASDLKRPPSSSGFIASASTPWPLSFSFASGDETIAEISLLSSSIAAPGAPAGATKEYQVVTS